MSTLILIAAILAILLAAGYGLTAIMARKAARQFPPQGRFVSVAGGRLHVIDLAPPNGPEPGAPAIVLLHGASANARELANTLGSTLAETWRVLSFDRPGHGWSDRPGGRESASAARQSQLIREGLRQLGVERAVVVAHSLAGAVATRMALDDPALVRGLVLLGAVTHEWPGGVTWYYTPAASSWAGWLFNRAVAVPVGSVMLDGAVRSVFAPDPAPDDYAERSGARLVLRPAEFLANAQDVVELIHGVRDQQHRYGEITAPVSVIHGLSDTTVSPDLHARAFARQVPGARLVLLPGGGHMPHHAARDVVLDEIEAVIAAARAAGDKDAISAVSKAG
jgi:pimeloyl-ACP methyl ester carboxylesterase